MTISTTGPIKFSDLQTEFGGSDPIGLGEYYAGGSQVADGTAGEEGNIPTSGGLSIGKFHGTSVAGIAWGGRYKRNVPAESFFTAPEQKRKVRYLNGKFIVLVSGPYPYIITSTDGVNWTETFVNITNENPSVNFFQLNDISYNGTKYVIVGSSIILTENSTTNDISAAAYVSTDLINWSLESMGAPSNSFAPRSVTWNNTYFICPVYRNDVDGIDHWVYTSTNGINWTQNVVSGLNTTFNAGGSHGEDILFNGFVTVITGDAGNIIYSTNGTSWSVAKTNSYQNFHSLTFGYNLFLALDVFQQEIWTSPNGVTWTKREPETNTDFQEHNYSSVVWFDNSFHILPKNDYRIYKSSDAITWTQHTLADYVASVIPNYRFGGANFTFATVGLGKIVIVGNPGFLTYDGTNYQSVYSTDSTLTRLNAISTNGIRTVIVGSAYSISDLGRQPTILSTMDNYNWTRRPVSGYSSYQELYDVIWNGEKFLAAGDGITILSSDGVVWTLSTDSPSMSIRRIVWDGTKFVGVGNTNKTFHSPDGIDWSYYEINGITETEHMDSIVWDGSKFVGLIGSYVRTSVNGITWDDPVLLPNISLPGQRNEGFQSYNIKYINNKYIIVGQKMTWVPGYAAIKILTTSIYSSNDAITWTEATLSTTHSYTEGQTGDVPTFDQNRCMMWNAAYAYGKYFACGYGGLWTSTDAINWTKDTRLTASNLGLTYSHPRAILQSKKSIISVGNNGKIMSSPPIVPTF